MCDLVLVVTAVKGLIAAFNDDNTNTTATTTATTKTTKTNTTAQNNNNDKKQQKLKKGKLKSNGLFDEKNIHIFPPAESDTLQGTELSALKPDEETNKESVTEPSLGTQVNPISTEVRTQIMSIILYCTNAS